MSQSIGETKKKHQEGSKLIKELSKIAKKGQEASEIM